ncbi:MAG TPA: hypothetical protein VFM25_06345, partial [Verrucomicrobiae bacterium]|nr:hypothetical protein [Verrucomicrobiae bacterium]
KMCSPNYGVRIRFIRPGKKLDVYLCFGCEILLVRTPDGWKEENFDLGRPALVELLKQLFPKDEEIKKLSTQKVDWKHIGF